MPCYHPITGYRTPTGVVFSELKRHDIISRIDIACGQCVGCRMQRASDWELRVMHEASQYPENCFITLTYAPGNLPPNASLEHRDFQLFLKKLRLHHFQTTGQKLRFYMCGEYGETTQRPHYHACLFNIDFPDRIEAGKSKSGAMFYESDTLTKIWGLGRATVQPLVRETASYCARYIMKKVLGEQAKTAYTLTDPETGEMVQRRPEYAAMSLRPGIGHAWFKRYGNDVFPMDNVIANGERRKVPKYYDRLAKRNGRDLDEITHKRELRGRAAAPDNTDERLAVKETVHLAKVKTLSRDLES